jgi:hypothetical protein
VAALRGSDVDLAANVVKVRTACRACKRVEVREINLPRGSVLRKLVSFLAARAKPGDFLFKNHAAKPWSACSLMHNFSNFRSEAGLPREAKVFDLGTGTVATSLK